VSEDRCGGIAPHARGFDSANPLAERRTLWVLILTAITMVLEIVAGWWYGSMALLADGWHMSSHVIALGLAVAAYVLARRLRRDDRFAFGTWKIEVLGGYTSALLLAGVVLYMAFECLSRLRNPGVIAYDQALGVAFLGGWLEQMSGFTEGSRLAMVGIISSLIMPSEALWRRAAFEMESPLSGSLQFSPFADISIPSAAMIGYACAYLFIALGIAVYHFGERDL
jgi:cation diffusion facilitator family transporter